MVNNRTEKLSPPNIDANVIHGDLVEFTIDDPVGNEGDRKKFTTNEIPQNVALWLFGMDCCFDPTLSEKYELVSAMLKVWGVFKGGDNKDTIMDFHEMEPYVFEAIAERQWTEITITLNEENQILHWDLIN